LTEIKNTRILQIIPFLLIVVLVCSYAHGNIIYVDDDAAGTNDGSSWENAYVYLQDALADANDSVKPVEIRVAQGIYRPNEGLIAIPEFDWRTTTFQLINGVTLQGGYAGISGADPNERNLQDFETILSGDLNGDDMEVLRRPGWVNDPNRAENSYHVVTSYQNNETAVLNGFIITRGHADYWLRQDHGGGMINLNSNPTVTNCMFIGNLGSVGGGIYNSNSNPTLKNCTFNLNMANSSRGDTSDRGGGMYNDQSSPTLIECIFDQNGAMYGGGMYSKKSNLNIENCTFSNNLAEGGGGISNYQSNLILTNCKFVKNRATWHGGGMYNYGNGDGVVDIINCTFIENIAADSGGGISNRYSNPNLTNCTFRDNSANCGGGMANYYRSNPKLNNCTFGLNISMVSGGGIYNFDGSKPILKNCTFCLNVSEDSGGGMYNIYNSNPILINCILWDNTPDQIDGEATVSVANVSYSDIKGGWPEGGIGIIDVDPLFADPNNGDYHLKSQSGRWDPNSGSWVKDDVTSPCIDAGDPNSDFSSETWPHGGIINMGAYGDTRQASMSSETEGMALPRVAYTFSDDAEAAENFESLLEAYGCPTTLISLDDVPATPLDSYDLLIVANDTKNIDPWSDPNTVAAIEDSGKPIVGLGDGGYDFFGLLGLSIGNPYGGHSSKNSIKVVDPNCSLFSTPYSIEIPQDRALKLYTETNSIGIYLWPTVPETVTVFGNEVNDVGYFPLVMQHNRYVLWGFAESPQKMTEIGKTLFINVVIWTANKAWESEN